MTNDDLGPIHDKLDSIDTALRGTTKEPGIVGRISSLEQTANETQKTVRNLSCVNHAARIKAVEKVADETKEKVEGIRGLPAWALSIIVGAVLVSLTGAAFAVLSKAVSQTPTP